MVEIHTRHMMAANNYIYYKIKLILYPEKYLNDL
jgi:hypothetical protein